MEYPKLLNEKGWMYDLRGRNFGYLTAVEPTDKRNRGDVVWLCQCRCGNRAEVAAVKLMRGHTNSCGCLMKEKIKSVNPCIEGTNLRQALKNNPTSARAASGYTGVISRRGKWQAVITYKKVRYCLGTFEKLEDAVQARAEAKEKIIEDAKRLMEVYKENSAEKDI